MKRTKFISACSLLLLILIMICCNSKKNKTITDKIIYSSPGREINIIDNEDAPKILLGLLNNTSNLEGAHVGIEGKESESFKIFNSFCFVTSDTALVRLTYHPNPKIRVYSIWALIKKNRKLALQQYQHLKNDTAIINYTTCDMTISSSVSSLLASYFDSTEVKKQ